MWWCQLTNSHSLSLYLKHFMRSDTVIGTSKTDRRAAKAGRPRLYTTLAEKFTMEATSFGWSHSRTCSNSAHKAKRRLGLSDNGNESSRVRKVPGNESSQELSFSGNESSGERKGPGTKVPGNLRSPRTKVPGNEKSREPGERKFP